MNMDCFGEANNGKMTGSFSHSEAAETLRAAVRADRVVILEEESGAVVQVTAYWVGPGEFSIILDRPWTEDAWAKASLSDVAMDLQYDATRLGKALMKACSGIESPQDG